MSDDLVLCPSCGRPMKLKRTLSHAKKQHSADHDTHVFQCDICGVAFVNEDHKPVAGRHV
jgi:ribosomal protein L37AE/L43A